MSSNLYVGNLGCDTTEFGEIESVSLTTDRSTGRSRGFAFVEMATEESAQVAISGLNGKAVDEREIQVDKAKPRAD